MSTPPRRRQPSDYTSLSSWNGRAPSETICCASMSQWSVRCWSTPAQSGTQVSLPRRRRHWRLEVAASSMKTATTRCHWSVLDSTRWSHGVKNLPSAFSSAVCCQRSAAGQDFHTQTAPRKNKSQGLLNFESLSYLTISTIISSIYLVVWDCRLVLLVLYSSGHFVCKLI